jgi:hypothetical protein
MLSISKDKPHRYLLLFASKIIGNDIKLLVYITIMTENIVICFAFVRYTCYA